MLFLLWAIRLLKNLAGSDRTYKELINTLRDEIKMLRDRESEANNRVDHFAHERNDAVTRLGALESTIHAQAEKIKLFEEQFMINRRLIESQSNHITELEQHTSIIGTMIKTGVTYSRQGNGITLSKPDDS